MNRNNIISWIARIVAAFILLQTVFFKFTSAPESIHLFETLGMEPWGRYGSGIGELIAGILLLIPRTKTIGALIALGVMSGAIFSHLTKLGIDFNGDGGGLFMLGVITFIASAVVLILHKKEIPFLNL